MKPTHIHYFLLLMFLYGGVATGFGHEAEFVRLVGIAIGYVVYLWTLEQQNISATICVRHPIPLQ